MWPEKLLLSITFRSKPQLEIAYFGLLRDFLSLPCFAGAE